jgi:predicted metal-dependent hydrolase
MPRLDATAQTAFLALPGGGEATLSIRRSRRARRVALRIVPGSGEVELVVPHRGSIKQGIAFAREKAEWLKAHLGSMPVPVPFEEGAVIPVHDRPRRIRRVDQLFRGVWLTERELQVSAPAEIVGDYVRRWLRTEARRVLLARAEEKARLVRRRIRRLTVRDTSTRWGSCSAEGDLSFSWRIVMAPDFALDYLVAHEVAHLVEMNHSPKFWAIVERIAVDPERGRDWLRDNGGALHRYGFTRRSIQAL